MFFAPILYQKYRMTVKIMEYVAILKEVLASVEAQIQSPINYVTTHASQGDDQQAT